MTIRKPTEFIRTTLSQEIRVILGPEEGVSSTSIRRVQILVPESPKMSAVLDVTPEYCGLDREYKLPTMPPGAQIKFDLLPHQWIIACANEKFVEASLIVEYL